MGATGSKVRASLDSGSKVRASLGSSHFLANGVAQGGGGSGECERRLKTILQTADGVGVYGLPAPWIYQPLHLPAHCEVMG